ncbi:hypothetical protein U1Q18_048126 [Sarracenia purpurea var. burkii]
MMFVRSGIIGKFRSEAATGQGSTQQPVTLTVANIAEIIKAFNKGNDIRRDYKLSKTTRVDLWLDKLKGECLAKEYPDITSDVVVLDDAQKVLLRDLLMNRMDDCYQERVVGVQDPIAILKEIIEEEKAANFLNRIDDVAKFFEYIGNPIPEDTIIDQGINGTYSVLPNVRLRVVTLEDVRSKIAGRKERISYSEFRNILLQEEAAALPKVDSTPKAMVAVSMRGGNSSSRGRGRGRGRGRNCFTCGKEGHISRFCYSRNRKCYECGDPNHIARNCPQKEDTQPPSQFRGDSRGRRGRGGRFLRGRGNFNSNFRPRPYYPRGRGGYRGRSGSSESYEHESQGEKEISIKTNLAKASENNQGNSCTSTNNVVKFVCDTGATDHMVKDPTPLYDREKCDIQISSANSEASANLIVSEKGKIKYYLMI